MVVYDILAEDMFNMKTRRNICIEFQIKLIL